MKGARIFHHTEKVGEAAERRSVGRVSAEGALACAGSPFGSHASEAPRPETPCHLGSATVVPRNAAFHLDWTCQKKKAAVPGIGCQVSTLICTFVRRASVLTNEY